MNGRSLALVAALAAASCGLALAEDGPQAKVETVTRPKATLVDLEAKDRPLPEVVAEVGKAIGFEALSDPDGALAGKTWTCSWKKKPAWECLVEIFDKTGTTLGGVPGGGVGLVKPKGPAVHHRAAGCLLVRFSQKPTGTKSEDPRARPFGFSIVGEPRLSFTLLEPKVSEQKNAKGDAADLLSLEDVGGRLQVRPGKDASSPWPGLASFEVSGKVSLVTKSIVAEVTGLARDAKKLVVEEGGKEVATLESATHDGRFLVIAVSLPSDYEGESVLQGGRGVPVEDAIEKQVGARVELKDAKGALVSPAVLVAKGDKKRLAFGLKLTDFQLQNAGGLETLRLRVTRPLEKTEEPLKVKFADLLGGK